MSDWNNMKKSRMIVKAKVWYYFVAMRLMPVNTKFEVLKKRVVLMHAIITNQTIDVGYMINQEMYGMKAKRT